MKITILEDSSTQEVEITIHCKKTDSQILRMIASLRSFDRTITGTKDGQTFLLLPNDILYIESVDKKTFIYTLSDIYESPLRLYEFEERLAGEGFFRASKSSVVNLAGVRSLRPDFGGRLMLTLNSGEKMTVSRQFAGTVKQKLGLGGNTL